MPPQNGQPRRVDISKPGMTFTVVQPYLAATKAYADWVDLTVTLTGPIPTNLTGLLGATLPTPQPAAGLLRRDSATGTAKAQFVGKA